MGSVFRMLLVYLGLYTCVLAKFDFTNIKVAVTDHSFSVLKVNRMQAVNRSLKLYDIHLHVLQLPITNLKTNIALLKRSNGYRPYFLNYTVDACKFLRNSNHVVNNFIYSFYKNYTNANHTCPINHDVLIKQFPSSSSKSIDFLPLPSGEYALDTRWIIDGKQRFACEIFFTYS